jgi:hypothetical protein
MLRYLNPRSMRPRGLILMPRCLSPWCLVMVRLGIEFLELELNSNSIYKYRGKKLCLGVEF